jgi:hypothetical protein
LRAVLTFTSIWARPSGGITSLLNPAGVDVPGVLPFSADYVVQVTGSQTATLYNVSGGVWTVVGPIATDSVGLATDVVVPWADLGVATPAATTLQLLAVASLADELTVWATLPDKNNPDWSSEAWTQYIRMGGGW